MYNLDSACILWAMLALWKISDKAFKKQMEALKKNELLKDKIIQLKNNFH